MTMSLLIALTVGLWLPVTQDAPELLPPGSCPSSRAYLAPQLNTLPQDGDLYRIQRQAIEMPIEQVLQLMGGAERARQIASDTRARAAQLIADGAEGAERRFHEDTILRADALIEILNCRTSQGV